MSLKSETRATPISGSRSHQVTSFPLGSHHCDVLILKSSPETSWMGVSGLMFDFKIQTKGCKECTALSVLLQQWHTNQYVRQSLALTEPRLSCLRSGAQNSLLKPFCSDNDLSAASKGPARAVCVIVLCIIFMPGYWPVNCVDPLMTMSIACLSEPISPDPSTS